jgi:ACS family hexuronate transporter-like MFS transporter
MIGIFVISTAINYLDRQTLATLAPLIRSEFSLSNTDYGLLVTAFSVSYMLCAPFAGWFVDRVGLTNGIAVAVGLWSLAGIATGLTSGLAGLVVCRAWLGLAEAGGIPAAGKAIHLYLRPAERALGHALKVGAGVRLANGVRRHRRAWACMDSVVADPGARERLSRASA